MLAVIRSDAVGREKALLILRRGADVYAHDSDGQTALSHAGMLGMHGLVIEMATAGEGIGDAVREVLDLATTIDGIVGPLADYIDVDRDDAEAIEAALAAIEAASKSAGWKQTQRNKLRNLL